MIVSNDLKVNMNKHYYSKIFILKHILDKYILVLDLNWVMYKSSLYYLTKQL